MRVADKRCRHCGIGKSFDAFRKDRRTKDGHSGWCILCQAPSQHNSRLSQRFKRRPGRPTMPPREALRERSCLDVLAYVGPLTAVQLGDRVGATSSEIYNSLNVLIGRGHVQVVGIRQRSGSGSKPRVYGLVAGIQAAREVS